MAGVRSAPPYLALSILLWYVFLDSGVHATVAGVLAAMTIPAKAPGGKTEDSSTAEESSRAEETDMAEQNPPPDLLEDLEHDLHPWVTFVIMPVFAFANAGVAVGGELLHALAAPVSLGIATGLFIGKQAGVFLFSWLAVRLKLAELPSLVNWKQIYGVCLICGIGFTMSLFITGLAYDSPALAGDAKVGILAGSLLSAVAGLLFLFLYSGAIKAQGEEH